VTVGNATITAGRNRLTVNQTSQNTAINWNSFSIGAGNTVTFVQPNRNSIALNRVVGGDASVIMGNLNSNGQVFLINPNGVLFGRGAQVSVGGLVASTLGHVGRRSGRRPPPFRRLQQRGRASTRAISPRPAAAMSPCSAPASATPA
jgi:filamentous hemagglutinin family protein